MEISLGAPAMGKTAQAWGGGGGECLSNACPENRDCGRNLGFRSGDPTVGELPNVCTSRSDEGGLMEVDLRTFPDDQLRQMCMDSAESPLGNLLKVQPGVEKHRLAYFTGELRRRPTIVMSGRHLYGRPPRVSVKATTASMGD
jgi:hypothetical protein